MAERQINRRSAMFFSALQPERFSDAVAAGTDIAVFDLEDGTAPDRKEEGRQKVRGVFTRDPGRPMLRMVRINNPRTADGMRDILAILDWESPPDGVALPKVERGDDVRLATDLICAVHPQVEFFLIMETPLALENVYDLATAAPQVKTLLMGCADFSGEMGSDRGWDALAYARGRLVAAAANARIDAMDGPFFDNTDEAGLKDEVRRVASMGFTGKASYDANQIAHIHAAFTPSAEEIAHARRILAAMAQDKVGVTRLDGKLVNESIAKSARRVLAVAERRGVIR